MVRASEKRRRGERALTARLTFALLWGGLVYGTIKSNVRMDARADFAYAVDAMLLRRDPLECAAFNLVGVYSMALAAIIWHESRVAKAVCIAATFTGSFSLLPYLIFLRPSSAFQETTPRSEGWERSRAVGWFLTFYGLFFVVWGALQGSRVSLMDAFNTSFVAHVALFDLACLFLTTWFLLIDDVERGPVAHRPTLALLSVLPGVGPGIYLLWTAPRPPKPERKQF